MTQQQFFWIQVGVAAFLAAIFLWGRRSKTSSVSIRLKNKSNTATFAQMNSKGIVKRQSGMSRETLGIESGFYDDIKVLNVIFMFNGHSFDAYEILNIPPGSNFDLAREAFNRAVAERPSQKEFLTAAMSAIIDEYKKAASS